MARQPPSIPRQSRHLDPAALRARLGSADPGLEPWWPLEGLRFAVLASGTYWLEGQDAAGVARPSPDDPPAPPPDPRRDEE